MEYPCYRIYTFDDDTDVLQIRMKYSSEERDEFIKKNPDYKKVDRVLIEGLRRNHE